MGYTDSFTAADGDAREGAELINDPGEGPEAIKGSSNNLSRVYTALHV
jgi:hypothetical protein